MDILLEVSKGDVIDFPLALSLLCKAHSRSCPIVEICGDEFDNLSMAESMNGIIHWLIDNYPDEFVLGK